MGLHLPKLFFKTFIIDTEGWAGKRPGLPRRGDGLSELPASSSSSSFFFLLSFVATSRLCNDPQNKLSGENDFDLASLPPTRAAAAAADTAPIRRD